jgi:nucleoside-diphosphate-sugar epimerase
MKKILVIGGSGYIGSKFYSNYKEKYQLTSVDLQLFRNDDHSLLQNYNNIDIADYDIILCFAAHSSVQMCEYSPDRSWINNVEYFKNLCNKINSSQQLIYMSSASIYGNSNNISDEDTNVNIKPIKDYDMHKLLIDIIANKYISYNKNIIGLRLGTVNGASPHTRKELMLNSMVTHAIDDKIIKIKNLSMKRSILGINDLMRSIESIIDNGCESGQYNLCSFTETVKTLGDIVQEKCNADLIEEKSDKIFYSFEMSTKKFEKTMNFNFRDTASSIIEELINNHNNTFYSTRFTDAEFKKYM